MRTVVVMEEPKPIDTNGSVAVDDIARILRVKPDTIKHMRNAGRLPLPDFWIGGNKPRWHYKTIKAIMDSGRI